MRIGTFDCAWNAECTYFFVTSELREYCVGKVLSANFREGKEWEAQFWDKESYGVVAAGNVLVCDTTVADPDSNRVIA